MWRRSFIWNLRTSAKIKLTFQRAHASRSTNCLVSFLSAVYQCLSAVRNQLIIGQTNARSTSRRDVPASWHSLRNISESSSGGLRRAMQVLQERTQTFTRPRFVWFLHKGIYLLFILTQYTQFNIALARRALFINHYVYIQRPARTHVIAKTR